MTTPKSLPRFAIVRHPTSGRYVQVELGQTGYWEIVADDALAAAFNHRHGVTAAMAQAMLIGSMFGWDVPGAQCK